MEKQEIEQKLSELIETKINRRNKQAINLPKDEGLINWMDTEISLLEAIESYLATIDVKYAKLLIETEKRSFYNGTQSGLMEAKTGRKHPEYLFKQR